MSIAAMNWIWEHSPASGNERLVLLAIADCADDEGRNAWPSIAKLATKARLDTRTVQRVITRLETAGHLAVERGAGRRGTNVYHLNLQPPEPAPAVHQAAADPRQVAGGGEPPGVAPGARGGVAQLCQGRGGTAAPPERPVPPVPPPPAREPGSPPPVVAQLDGGGGEPARAFFTTLGPDWPLSRGQRRRLTPAVTAALAAGWNPAALARHAGANTHGVRNPYAVLRTRLTDLPDPPSTAREPIRPTWCGTCHPDTRRLENPADGADAGPCPTCHPTTGRGIAAREDNR